MGPHRVVHRGGKGKKKEIHFAVINELNEITDEGLTWEKALEVKRKRDEEWKKTIS